jgi:hypothetical protein
MRVIQIPTSAISSALAAEIDGKDYAIPTLVDPNASTDEDAPVRRTNSLSRTCSCQRESRENAKSWKFTKAIAAIVARACIVFPTPPQNALLTGNPQA